MNNQTALEEQLMELLNRHSCISQSKTLQDFYRKELMALIDTAVQKAVPEKMTMAADNLEQIRIAHFRTTEEAVAHVVGFNEAIDRFLSNWEKVKKGIDE